MTPLVAAARRRPELVAGAALAALVLLLFEGLVLRGRALYNRDLQLFWYTQVESLVRIVTAPSWPLWDPYNAFGQPLLADPSAEVLYPPTWLNLLMRPWVFYSLFVVGHLWGSGLGLLRLGTSLGLSRAAALVSASVWVASGPIVSLANNPPHFAGACWIPWVLFAAERAARRPSVSAVCAWALALAGQILAGSADMCALGLLACGALLWRHVDWRSWRRSWPLARNALGTFALAAGLTAALWLPASEVALASSRRELPEFMRTYWSVHPASLLETFIPLGSRNLLVNAELRSLLYEDREPFLASLYLGLPTLALALLALLGPDRRLRSVLFGLLAAAVSLALGRHFPLLPILLVVFPPARILRYPVKALVLAAVAVALLAGMGFDAGRQPARQEGAWRRRVKIALALAVALDIALWIAITFASGPVARLVLQPLNPGVRPFQALAGASLDLGLALALAAAALVVTLSKAGRGPGRVGATSTLLAVLALADLVLQHHDLHPTASRDLLRHRPAAIDLIPAGREARTYVYDYLTMPSFTLRHLGRALAYTPVSLPPGWSFREAEALAGREALKPPIAATWGRETAFDLDYRGLYPRELNRLVLMLRSVEGTPAHRRLLQLAGVTHVVALHEAGFEDLQPIATLPGFALDPVRVFKVPDPLPRVYAVGTARVADDDAGIRALLAPEFDATREVVLAEGAASRAPADFAASCRVVAARADQLRIDVELTSPGHVVVLDSYAPGWRATVDGVPARVERANIAFRAVAVPSGRHEVVLAYRPRAVLWGLAASLLAGVLTLAGLLGRGDAGRLA